MGKLTASRAKKELDLLLRTCDKNDPPVIKPYIPEILALCKKFGEPDGLSDAVAPFVATALAQTIKKLLLNEPLTPIMNLPEEWILVGKLDVDRKPIYQNIRESAIFKEGKNGQPYYLDAITFKRQDKSNYRTNGAVFTQSNKRIGSRQYIKSFPFTPKTFYIDVVETGTKGNMRDRFDRVKDDRQLAKVFGYYDYMEPMAEKKNSKKR